MGGNTRHANTRLLQSPEPLVAQRHLGAMPPRRDVRAFGDAGRPSLCNPRYVVLHATGLHVATGKSRSAALPESGSCARVLCGSAAHSAGSARYLARRLSLLRARSKSHRTPIRCADLAQVVGPRRVVPCHCQPMVPSPLARDTISTSRSTPPASALPSTTTAKPLGRLRRPRRRRPACRRMHKPEWIRVSARSSVNHRGSLRLGGRRRGRPRRGPGGRGDRVAFTEALRRVRGEHGSWRGSRRSIG